MAFGSEVTAKLGIDTASVPQDLAQAKGAMQKFAQEAGSVGEKSGAGTGDKFATALEHRLVGSRHLAGALATALGLNIDKIAESVTAGLVGGTKEAWKEMGQLAEENAKLIEKRIELAMTPKQLQDKIKTDASRAAGELQGAGAETSAEKFINKVSLTGAMKDNLTKIATLMGVVSSEAEKQDAIGRAQLKSNEAEVRLAERNKEVKESHKKLDEFRAADAAKHLNSTEKLAALNDEINATLKEIISGKLSETEIDEKKKHLIELQGQIEDEQAARTQREIDKKQELLRLQESYVEAQRRLAQDEEEFANKRADRGKQTVDEIANMKAPSHEITGPAAHVDTFGLSEEAAQAKELANEIQRQQAEAERRRKSGDVAGANELFDQVSAGKEKLVASGFAKSTEADDFKKMAETIHKDNAELQKILLAIQTTAQGKLKNQ